MRLTARLLTAPAVLAAILPIALASAMIAPAFAQTICQPSGISGAPDCSFGGGLVTTALPGGFGTGTDVVAQPADGKLVVVGYGYPANTPQGGGYDWYVLRYNPDGTLDGGFGDRGIATTSVTPALDAEYARAVALQTVESETRIVVAGSAPLKSAGNPQFGVALVRFRPGGQLDTSFGTNGRVQFGWSTKGDSSGYELTLQCDGKIVGVGKYGADMGVARLLPNGSFDTSFGTGGKTLLSLGKAAAADTIGGAYAVAMQSFGGAQPSGCPAEQRILVAGNRPIVNGTGTSRDMAVVRLLPNASLDSSFGSGGRAFIDNARSVDYAWGVGVDLDNRVVVSGYTNTGSTNATVDFAVARLTTAGILDTTFGQGGKVTTDINRVFNVSESQLAIDGNGRILVSGISQDGGTTADDFAVVRYNTDGSLDTTFGTGGTAIIDFGVGTANENYGRVALDPAGRIIIVGSTNASKLVAITALNP
jgi:uncharacterized delta-60 repeat protein